MPLSTSSSDHVEVSGEMLPDRMSPLHAIGLLTVLFSLATLSVALLRPDRFNPAEYDSFWRMKLAWHHDADVVVLGNSRVYRGFNPAAFTQACPGLRVRNFGFSATVFSTDYLHRGMQVLDPQGARAILVGFTPLLFKFPDTPDGFKSAQKRDRQFRLPWTFQAMLERWLIHLRPIEVPLPAKLRQSQRLTNSGFMEVTTTVNPPDAKKLRNDLQRYVTQPYYAPAYAAFLDSIGHAVANGYRVFVYYVPTSAAVDRIDTEMTGLDPDMVSRDVTAHGAVMLHPDTHDLEAYDGSHLTGASAALLSQRLGAAVHDSSVGTICGSRPTGATTSDTLFRWP